MPTHLCAVFTIALFEFCYGTPVQTEFQNDDKIVVSVADMASQNENNYNYAQQRTLRKSVTTTLNYAATNKEEGETFFGCLHRVSYHPRSWLEKNSTHGYFCGWQQNGQPCGWSCNALWIHHEGHCDIKCFVDAKQLWPCVPKGSKKPSWTTWWCAPCDSEASTRKLKPKVKMGKSTLGVFSPDSPFCIQRRFWERGGSQQIFDRKIPQYPKVEYNRDNNGKHEKPFVLAQDGSIDWKNRANWPLCFQSDLLTPLKWGSVCFFDEKHTQQSMGRKGSAEDKLWVLPHGSDGNIDTANGTYTPTQHKQRFKYRQEPRFVAGCVKQADTNTTIKTRVSPPFGYTSKFGWKSLLPWSVSLVLCFDFVFVVCLSSFVLVLVLSSWCASSAE